MRSKFSKALVLLLTLALVATQLMVPAFATETVCTCDESTRTGQLVDTIPATCVNFGMENYKCDECGGAYFVVTSAKLPHDEVAHAGQPADCDTAGWKDYVTCNDCSYTTYEEIPATGHTPKDAVKENEVAADCDDAGSYDMVVYCDVCNAELSRETIDVSATGHTPKDAVKENEVTADCDTDGSYESVVYCDVCNAELSRETVKTDDALGHNWNEYDRDLVDSGNPAQKIYYECLNGCGETKEELVCDDHTYVKQIIQAQDCVHPEITTHTCSVCTYVYTKETKPAKGHTEVVDAAVAPTCTETGLTAGSHCDVCSEIIVAQTVVPALGHDYVAVVTAPTCKEEGYTTYTCSRCDDSYTADTVPADPTLHNPSITVSAKAPTCTEAGHTYELACSACQVVLYEKQEVPALGHTPAAAVEENRVEATCTDDGSYDMVVYCDVCDAELSRTPNTIAATGHSLTSHAAQAPDCVNVGWNAYEDCANCDYTTYVEIPANGHDFEYTLGVKDPTCDEEGYTLKHCKDCNLDVQTDIVAALGHDIVNHDAKAPTCTDIGWDAYETCSRCAYTTYVEKAALGHDYVAVVTAPTCTTDGFTTHTCSRCNDTYTNTPVAALGHTPGTPVDENVVAATCTANGTKDVVTYCSVCNEELSRNTETTDAALGHLNDIVLERVEPTYDETGLEEGVKCSACGVDTTPQVVIPRKSEEINFTYEATGINGTAVAVNSGRVFVNVYMNVTSDFARLYAFDLEYTFDPAELVLVGAESEAFGVIDYNVVGNTVKLSPNMGLIATGKTFNKGKYLVATLTFVVNSAFTGTTNINFETGAFARDTDVLKNELNVDYGTGVGIQVVKLGDANGDTHITSKDTLELAKWIGAADEGDYEAIYDLNKDGKINGDDFTLMRKAAVGNEDYLDDYLD